ncbi:MAG: tetratricopeptide repeat protein [Treponema sp.]
MENKFEKATIGEKLSAYIESWRTILLIVLIAAVLGVAAYSIAVTVISKSDKNGISAIDTISYNLSNESSSLSDEELDSRRNSAMKALEQYVSKGRITGVRANMLAAEIAYAKKDFATAASYWTAAAAKGKKSYTAPLAYFNAAVSYEAAGDLDNALANYKTASECEDFPMLAHAMFSYGRLLESKGDSDEALKVYKKLFDKVPDDSWAKLAKSRIIDIENSKKAE